MPSRTRPQESHTPQVDLKFSIPAGKDNLRAWPRRSQTARRGSAAAHGGLQSARDAGIQTSPGASTGVRLSTAEGCDLGFYGCGDAGVPTGSRLRIVITAGGRWWSRSVYRAGPVHRAPLGPPQGTAAA